MARADLNAKRAARSEAENAPHEVALGFDADGKERVFFLKPRLPVAFVELLREGRIREALQLLLVDPADWEPMRAADLDSDDLMAICELYGVDLPESPASTRSSTNGGPSSRPTSKRRTGSTSHKPAGAREPSASGDWPR